MIAETTSGSAPAVALLPDGTYPVRVSAFQQWRVLTGRGVTKVYRNGEFIFAFVSPALLALCFYLPLRKVVAETLGVDYAQFLMPIILLQSVAFVASSAAIRSALDGQEGVHNRFRVLPMAPVVPLLARATTNLVLLLVAVVCGLIAVLLMGWRPIPFDDGGGGLAGAAGAIVIIAVFGFLLAMAADAIGLVAKSPQATSQLIAFPSLILGMLSTGFVPLVAFPTWIRGFVQWQPISQITTVMRSAQRGELTWEIFAPTCYWWLGLIALTGLLLLISLRRAAR